MSIQQYLRLQIKYKQYNQNMLYCLRTNNDRRYLYWSRQISKLYLKIAEYSKRPWYDDFWNKVAEIVQN